jgi:DNA-directed RNA polymerase specialized sigma24 family protein
VQHRLRATEVDEVVAAYLAGERVNDLAARFGVHRTTVMAHLARRGAKRPTRDWDTGALGTAAALYNQGLSLAAVADRFGINPSTVANRFRRAGVTIRPRRGWAWYQTPPTTP